jgi:hypothetical protein
MATNEDIDDVSNELISQFHDSKPGSNTLPRSVALPLPALLTHSISCFPSYISQLQSISH